MITFAVDDMNDIPESDVATDRGDWLFRPVARIECIDTKMCFNDGEDYMQIKERDRKETNVCRIHHESISYLPCSPERPKLLT